MTVASRRIVPGPKGGSAAATRETDDYRTNSTSRLLRCCEAAIEAGAVLLVNGGTWGAGIEISRAADLYGSRVIPPMDVIALRLGAAARRRAQPANQYESIVAVSRYERGTLGKSGCSNRDHRYGRMGTAHPRWHAAGRQRTWRGSNLSARWDDDAIEGDSGHRPPAGQTASGRGGSRGSDGVAAARVEGRDAICAADRIVGATANWCHKR